jgi:hypothetical protein
MTQQWEYVTLFEHEIDDDEIKELEAGGAEGLDPPCFRFLAEGVESFWESDVDASLSDALNELGKDGWELVSSFIDDLNGEMHVLKRPKAQQ